MTPTARTPLVASALAGLGLLAALAAPAALAQFKVVEPNGKVTYTDREPIHPVGKVISLAARDAAPAAPALPAELQQAASRYPAVLYVSGGVCAACDSGRQMLRQRGVPFVEKQVLSAADGVAYERLTGARDVPTLTLGAQTLRGFATEVWSSYLDAASYPRESRLPAGYEFAAPTPLTQRQESLASRGNAPGTAGTTVLPSGSATAPPPPPASGIRF